MPEIFFVSHRSYCVLDAFGCMRPPDNLLRGKQSSPNPKTLKRRLCLETMNLLEEGRRYFKATPTVNHKYSNLQTVGERRIPVLRVSAIGGWREFFGCSMVRPPCAMGSGSYRLSTIITVKSNYFKNSDLAVICKQLL